MPSVWRTLGPLPPPGAGTTLVRNITYFDANALTGALEVLGTYAAAGSPLVLVSARHPMRSSATELEAVAATGLAA